MLTIRTYQAKLHNTIPYNEQELFAKITFAAFVLQTLIDIIVLDTIYSNNHGYMMGRLLCLEKNH